MAEVQAQAPPAVLADSASLANHPREGDPMPQAPFMDSRAPSSSGVRDSALADSTAALGVSGNTGEEGGAPADATNTVDEPVGGPTKPTGRRRLLLALAALLVLAVVVIAVVVPVYFTVVKPRQERSSSSSSTTPDGTQTTGAPRPTSSDSASPPTVPVSGGDGSTVTTEDGETFVYKNTFGGFWYSDPDDPYNDSAQPNSWTPPLNASFNYATNRIYGVNLGGLFVLEPFISPALFQRYPGATDEWDLSVAMAADTENGGLSQLEEHYSTFITEQDIAEIAGAGLNWVRLPIPFWAVDEWPGEPFLAKTSWKYIVRVFHWCRKYGLRVNLDLHTIPGSHNRYNHGGKSGAFNFLNGAMGMANAQRTLYYIQVITEFINQPEWRNVVPMFSIMNEPIVGTIGAEQLRAFYIEAHRIIREITGFGEGQGPYVAIHDGFIAPSGWAGFMRGADRVAMDYHPYFAFGGDASPATIDTGVGSGAGGPWPSTACSRFGGMTNNSRTDFGVTVAGEWSLAWNDCGLFLRGTDDSHSYAGGCAPWDDSSNWSESIKAGLMAFASAQMDGLSDYFFWTWKIGESTRGIVEAPFWSYQLGLRGGWLPTDPRSAVGTCEAIGQPGIPWSGTFEPYMTGGTGAGLPSDASTYPWPPPVIAPGLDVAALPTYTSTGTPVALPAPTFTDSRGNDIVRDNQASFPAPTPVTGCSYPDAWAADELPAPGACLAV